MSNTRDDETRKPLPGPIEEDGIVRDKDEQLEEDLDGLDGGLADVGSGKSDERKITG